MARVRFLSPLQVERAPRDRWRLLADLAADIDVRGVREIVTVPAGLVTDFASVPRLPLAFLLAGDTAHAPAVLHDWLYAERRPRAWADAVFLAAMQADGVPWWRRRLMHAAVRVAGGAAWGSR